LEYGRALALLDRLVETATPAEFDVMNSLVTSRDEFAVYTNLSRRVEPAAGALTERKDADKNNWQQRGFDWVMALARVELGAIVAGFTDLPDPFEQSEPSPSELRAYREVLVDSTRTHYWAIRNDPAARSLRFQAEPQAIAYARRVTLALEFVRASRRLSELQLTRDQRVLLDAWELELAELQRAILYGVLRLDDPATIAAKQAMFQGTCGRILTAARADPPASRIATPPIPSSASIRTTAPPQSDRPAAIGTNPNAASKK